MHDEIVVWGTKKKANSTRAPSRYTTRLQDVQGRKLSGLLAIDVDDALSSGKGLHLNRMEDLDLSSPCKWVNFEGRAEWSQLQRKVTPPRWRSDH